MNEELQEDLAVDEFITELIEKDGASEEAIIAGFAMLDKTVVVVKVQRPIAGSPLWLTYNESMSIYLMTSKMREEVYNEMIENDWWKRYYWGFVDPNDGSLWILAGPPCNQDRSW